MNRIRKELWIIFVVLLSTTFWGGSCGPRWSGTLVDIETDYLGYIDDLQIIYLENGVEKDTANLHIKYNYNDSLFSFDLKKNDILELFDRNEITSNDSVLLNFEKHIDKFLIVNLSQKSNEAPIKEALDDKIDIYTLNCDSIRQMLPNLISSKESFKFSLSSKKLRLVSIGEFRGNRFSLNKTYKNLKYKIIGKPDERAPTNCTIDKTGPIIP
jgi:hypothetical protein